MKSASRLFYLSVFALWAGPGSCLNGPESCVVAPDAIVGDACVSFSVLEQLNNLVKPKLDELTRDTDFFSHYRLNLFHKSCPFWNDENGMCGNIGCAVETLDNEEDIPEVWRAHSLSKLEGPRAQHPGKKARDNSEKPLQGKLGEDVGESCVFEYDDECDERDYCVPEDESASSKGDYVSLIRNPERFTGYAGFGAAQVWDAIYRENCFQKSSFPRSANLGTSQWSQNRGPAAQDFKEVMDAAGRQAQLAQQRRETPNAPFVANTGFEVEDECIEKRVFYRLISGMHASISTHLCWDFLNQTTGEWQPNLSCYEHRLHKFPDRISNVYFNYAILARAVGKIGPYLEKSEDYTFCTGDPDEDDNTRQKIAEVTQKLGNGPELFDEGIMFVNGEGPSLKEDFRNRFRNVSRLMDCVGCDKCRLWGKLQTSGYGTALKILFEFDNKSGNIPVLQRTELVALFNTYARISSSMGAIGEFRKMMQQKILLDQWTEEAEEARKLQSKEELDPDMVAFLKMQRGPPAGATTGERFAHELARFGLATKVIVKGWIRGPKTIYDIIKSELIRLYQFWLGVPITPRWWTFRLPELNRDEL